MFELVVTICIITASPEPSSDNCVVFRHDEKTVSLQACSASARKESHEFTEAGGVIFDRLPPDQTYAFVAFCGNQGVENLQTVDRKVFHK